MRRRVRIKEMKERIIGVNCKVKKSAAKRKDKALKSSFGLKVYNSGMT